MSDPEYVRQTGGLNTPETFKEWVHSCAAAARSRGCQSARVTRHDVHKDFYLYEAWVDPMGEQGAPQWAEVRA